MANGTAVKNPKDSEWMDEADTTQLPPGSATPDLTSPSEQNPVVKFLRAGAQNLIPSTNPLNYIPPVDPISQSYRLVKALQEPSIEGKLAASSPLIGAGDQLYNDIRQGGYAEAGGHALADILPLLVAGGAGEVNPGKISAFAKGYGEAAPKLNYSAVRLTPAAMAAVALKRYLMGPVGGWEGDLAAGAGGVYAASLPKMIKGGMKASEGIPWRRPPFVLKEETRFTPEQIAEYQKTVQPTSRSSRIKVDPPSWRGGVEGEPIPKSEPEPPARFTPEQIAEYQSTVQPRTKVTVKPPATGIADIDAASARPGLVKVRSPKKSAPSDRSDSVKNTGTEQGSVTQRSEPSQKSESSQSDDEEPQGIKDHKENLERKVNNLHDFAQTSGMTYDEVKSMSEEDWKDFQEQARQHGRKKGVKVPDKRYRGNLKGDTYKILLKKMRGAEGEPLQIKPAPVSE